MGLLSKLTNDMQIPASTDESQRQLALEQHACLRRKKSSAIAYGRFYIALLEAKVWRSQADLAIALSVSQGYVSKAVKAARLPVEVFWAFGSDRRVSFRVAEALGELVQSIGIDRLRMNAAQIGSRPDLPVEQLLRALAAGARPDYPSAWFRMSLGRNGRYIRIDSPEIASLLPRLEQIEAAFNYLIRSQM